jgi:hypothetical protein
LKVYINKYRDNWLSPYTILDKVFFWREIDYEEPVIARWSDRLQPLCLALQSVLGVINPKIDWVKIDRWDTWSMDHTLSQIALPMLIQLQKSTHGAPGVDDKDVPEHLRSTAPGARDNCEEEWDIDDNHFLRWDWVLKEMIHAHRSKVDDAWEDQFWTGEWGDTLWEKSDVEFPNPITGKMESTYSMSQTGTRECDWDGLKKEQERIQNGFRLFGKYYQNLWD